MYLPGRILRKELKNYVLEGTELLQVLTEFSERSTDMHDMSKYNTMNSLFS
jgi:hypothetical protein